MTTPYDPIFYHDGSYAMVETTLPDPTAPGWYFWIETWADVCGPYSTERQARTELTDYVKELERHEP